MRSILVVYSVFAVMLTTSACDNGDDDPDEVPRTVPPTSVPSAAPDADPIEGTGPIIEAYLRTTASRQG